MLAMDTTPDPTPLSRDPEPVRTQSDLLQLWRGLMGELGFSLASTWVLHLDEDDRPTRRLLQIEDCADDPVPADLDSLTELLLRVGGTPPGRWVFLRSRPGRHGPDRTDHAWARGLAQACRRAGVVSDVVHLATDQRLVPLPVDDLPVDDLPGDLPATA